MIAQNITSFTLSKGFYDMGNINFRVRNETPHVMLALEGDLGNSWHYDTHYSYGKNIFRSNFTNNFAPAFYAFAADAVQVGGSIVCRGVRDNVPAAAGCVPLNVFGPQSIQRSAPGAQDYVNRAGFSRVGYVQHSAAVNVRGEPFATWAGPVSIAFGGEWRSEKQKLTADALSTAGRFLIGNATPFAGKFNVKEGYFEALVPLAREVYADRAYGPGGNLVSRKQAGSVIHDVDAAVARVLRMVEAQSIETQDGGAIRTRIDSVAVHGDTPGAVAMARRIRDALVQAGMELRPMAEVIASS